VRSSAPGAIPAFLRTRFAALADIGRQLPPQFVSLHFVAALEFARHMQWLVPPAGLDGRSFAIRVEDLGLCSHFTCRQQHFRPYLQVAGAHADLEISARLADFISLARGTMDADTLFFQRRLTIAGDTELGLIVKNWLDAIERPAWLAGT
jgi:predicted lipid carrier protein YhbT